MILVALLGMNPRAAFPIMMGSCAFLMPIGGLRFLARDSYSFRAADRSDDRRHPGGPFAAFLVKSPAADLAEVAGVRGRALHRVRDAAFGADAPRSGGAVARVTPSPPKRGARGSG
jgi:hypothetical protein